MMHCATIVKKAFNLIGLKIERKNTGYIPVENQVTMDGALARAKLRGCNPSTILDVGAAQGRWTAMAKRSWADAHYVLFEPLQERKGMLDAFARQTNNVEIIDKGVGEGETEIEFYITPDLDGSGVAHVGSYLEKRRIKTTSLDIEANSHHWKGPYLIKLDTHGHEVPILKGATRVLADTEMIIIECYGFQIAPDSLLLGEMIANLDQLGFRLIDIVDICHRPRDLSFWQCDAVFVRKNHPCFSKIDYL